MERNSLICSETDVRKSNIACEYIIFFPIMWEKDDSGYDIHMLVKLCILLISLFTHQAERWIFQFLKKKKKKILRTVCGVWHIFRPPALPSLSFKLVPKSYGCLLVCFLFCSGCFPQYWLASKDGEEEEALWQCLYFLWISFTYCSLHMYALRHLLVKPSHHRQFLQVPQIFSNSNSILGSWLHRLF